MPESEKTMAWFFKSTETVLPELVSEADEQTTNEIIETPFTGCAWCHIGDENGMCQICQDEMLAKSVERSARRHGR